VADRGAVVLQLEAKGVRSNEVAPEPGPRGTRRAVTPRWRRPSSAHAI